MMILRNESDTDNIAKKLANHIAPKLDKGVSIWLSGDLGSGKSTFCRYFMRHMGVVGRMKSPTYSLVESYQVCFYQMDIQIIHADLYRQASAHALDEIGFFDYYAPYHLLLIEWASDVLPSCDYHLHFDFLDNSAMLDDIDLNHARLLRLKSNQGNFKLQI